MSLTVSRWPIRLQRGWRLQLVLQYQTFAIILAHRPSRRSLLQFGLPWPGCRRSFTQSFALGPLSPGLADLSPPYLARHPAGLSRGYTTLCAASTVGRMDCPGFDNTTCRFGRGYMCHEENIGLAESTKEENCGKC